MDNDTPYDVTYMVTVTIMPGEEHPGESAITKAVYLGTDINSEDCVHVERV